ncbi:Protein RALF-like 33 [Bienertia sinuspersici]
MRMKTFTSSSFALLLLIVSLLVTMSYSFEDSNEYDMSSETNRRVLEGISLDFISYGVLLANYIPCSKKGSSYYNCGFNDSANPYNRGCNQITRCQRG